MWTIISKSFAAFFWTMILPCLQLYINDSQAIDLSLPFDYDQPYAWILYYNDYLP